MNSYFLNILDPPPFIVCARGGDHSWVLGGRCVVSRGILFLDFGAVGCQAGWLPLLAE